MGPHPAHCSNAARCPALSGRSGSSRARTSRTWRLLRASVSGPRPPADALRRGGPPRPGAGRAPGPGPSRRPGRPPLRGGGPAGRCSTGGPGACSVSTAWSGSDAAALGAGGGAGASVAGGGAASGADTVGSSSGAWSRAAGSGWLDAWSAGSDAAAHKGSCDSAGSGPEPGRAIGRTSVGSGRPRVGLPVPLQEVPGPPAPERPPAGRPKGREYRTERQRGRNGPALQAPGWHYAGRTQAGTNPQKAGHGCWADGGPSAGDGGGGRRRGERLSGADSAEIAGLGRHCVADGRRNRDVVGVQVVVDVAVEVMGDRDVGEGHVDAARHARGGVLLADTTASPSSSRGPVTTQQPSSRRSSVPSGGTTFISWRS